MLFTTLRERQILNKRNISSNLALNVAVIGSALEKTTCTLWPQRWWKQTMYIGGLTVATLQFIKASILSVYQLAKQIFSTSHSDIFKKIVVLNLWQKYLKNIREAHFSSCIFLLYSNKLLRFRKFLPHSQKFGTTKYLSMWHSRKLCLTKTFHRNIRKSCLF